MKTPPWLVELYRQWMTARGKRVVPRIRSFSRQWDDLLDCAGIKSAEDRKTALRQAEVEERQGNLKLKRLRGRAYIIQTVELPLAAESWLLQLFDQQSSAQNLAESLQAVEEAKNLPHPRFPVLWQNWCLFLEEKFCSGKNARPLYWRSPGNVRAMLALIHKLTSSESWSGMLIREVSVAVGLDSKGLERQQLGVEACLSQMYGRLMTLQSLGVSVTDSRAAIAGIMTLHFADGSEQTITELKAPYGLSLEDLNRAQRISTPALRLLTVENSKTTLRRLAMSNADGATLLAACSYPTKALQRMLNLLPENLPFYHFGDTDPAGFQILAKLREATSRTVRPFLMRRRTRPNLCPLSEYDLAILPRLLEDPSLSDVAEDLRSIWVSKCKGDFEQETLGLPDQSCWPFYSLATREIPEFGRASFPVGTVVDPNT